MPRVLAYLLLLILVGCGHNGAGQAGKPPPEKEALQWSTTELVQHLRSRGVNLTIANPGPLALVVKGDAPFQLGAGDPQRGVAIEALQSPRDAKDKASQFGEGGFAWGRFAIFVPPRRDEGDPELFEEIKNALP